ncbi:hypothetical protein M501DRAFT_1011478 [Patellaria atrata CBS 101060]|uniref:CTLH domain-containing protein n=1 Tax=Patellaria atrata CBS 101060 TaxID=1346257 RepID=A0A9P4S9P6_9PEZI|nr:hypothetical protein M501DRAFT_1011478 [Patellaria atrata CBS 101060]
MAATRRERFLGKASVGLGTSTRHVFERRVEEIKPSKTDINSVIMDYLITEGYPHAAKTFAMESNIQNYGDRDSIEQRVAIRKAIHAGDIQSAIEKINDLNPQILDHDSSLHFALLRLQLIELIRTCTSTPNGDITPALTFATTQLAPRAPTNDTFLADLEKTMALLIFPRENLSPPLAGLLDSSLRQQVATRVNEAILLSQGKDREAKIKGLIKLRVWSEQKARDNGVKDLPSRLPLGLDDEVGMEASEEEEEEEDEDETMNGGADDPMVP